MAMLITARKVSESPSVVQYAYGIEGEPAKTLEIEPSTGALLTAEPHDPAIGKIYIKIKHRWESTGQYPHTATFSS